ncbi:heme ABC transporter permease CcmC [Reinekea sp. G2M2-21]|jgi:heme exporter protein C|uniref:heme ABC transporter permease CcmC n=1 Tax=Reinekea sp. G2M2-21 TaxID=2788942 RepID=UPI001E603E51|nr:heme ABC transporter permease CcmC [Reinekea sp. G2M2-21]MDX1341391.1 heme ABC transporter permease CcmC [Reinekea sp.]MDX1472887.1 heme ABC transporter permease CcmC [Reinekea sp.]
MWQMFVRWFHKWSSPKWFYEMSRPWSFWLGWAAVLLIATALVWGLAFSPVERVQGNSYRIIFLHVPAAFLAQAIYMTIAIAGAVGLVWRIKLAFYAAKQCVPIGTSMALLALITGAIWGKPTWGAWWVWDARLTSMLILLLLYLGLWALQNAMERQESGDRAAAILALVGVVNIPIIKFSVNWWNTLHQPATLKISSAAPMHVSMLIPLLMSILGFYLAFGAWMLIRTRLEILDREKKAKWAQEEIKRLEAN